MPSLHITLIFQYLYTARGGSARPSSGGSAKILKDGHVDYIREDAVILDTSAMTHLVRVELESLEPIVNPAQRLTRIRPAPPC